MRTKLSERSKAENTWEGPYEGVPEWMSQPLTDWVSSMLHEPNHLLGRLEPNRERLMDLQQALRIRLNWSNRADGAWADLATRAWADPELFLDLVDECLAFAQTYEEIEPLRKTLDGSGSVWTLGRDGDGQIELQRRVDPSVAAAVKGAPPVATSPAIHLSKAWSSVYGRNPAPSEGYREAVRAVEAAAVPLISPANGSATLGSMLAEVKSNPYKWGTVLNPPAPVNDVAAIIATIELLWKAQLDRHGSSAPTPYHASQPEAEAALHIAAALVHLFTSGAIKVK